VASQIRVDAPRALETSYVVGGDAEGLRAELARLSREWDNVVAGWSGAAASSYAALWEEWHDGAAKLVETLAHSSQLVDRAAVAYGQTETTSAQSVRSVSTGIVS
jgi:WXG100 family type VII secretion target